MGKMSNKVRTLLAVAVALAVAVGGAAAQAGGSSSSHRLLIKLDDFKLRPDDASARAGKVRIKAKNVGTAEHELVVAATNLRPGKLPTTGNGDVDEDALDVKGEVSEKRPGKAGTVTLNLRPRKYVMFCNVPGHYAAGMDGRLTVK